jgi:magnesium transporter
MARFLKNTEARKGLHPGSLVFIGKKKVEDCIITVLHYDSEKCVEQPLDHIRDSSGFIRDTGVAWINIDGLHCADVIQEAGQMFNLHPLLLEDIMHTGQRPKLEEFDNGLFLVLRMLRLDETGKKIISEQLGIVFDEKVLLTFQEVPGDVFDPVRERLMKKKGRVRNAGPDYLAYSLLDTVVDNYIEIIEHLGEDIEDLELEILAGSTQTIMERINHFKREMNYLRKCIRPARDMVVQMARLDSHLIKESSHPFIKDLADLFTQAAEVIDTYRDMLNDMTNLYNTFMTNRMNDIMKHLTVFAAIFIPLTFIAGVYGTNFDHLPELHYRYSYFIFLGVLFLIAVLMLAYFKRKKWF